MSQSIQRATEVGGIIQRIKLLTNGKQGFLDTFMFQTATFVQFLTFEAHLVWKENQTKSQDCKVNATIFNIKLKALLTLISLNYTPIWLHAQN